ncbi:hypothetical protein DUNSADRAFT_5538 [Dunaliella salina]|uniref:Uncharacterized protein n=1 Tax=Dunaliella salina TaxID=3046 RepID=A0ABQ7GQ29_DUNSA|nr:hypothetical protein DUNSADRAFT_5538 [Dunaliella salina]|eukprot:KAF5836711.1 hypothetical protein DUNSADRAFT_5538 [Dunaliella salina]
MIHLFQNGKSALAPHPAPQPAAPAAAEKGGNAHAEDKGSAMEVVIEEPGGASESAAAVTAGASGGEAGAEGIEVVRNVAVLTNDNGMCILLEAGGVCAARTQDLPHFTSSEPLERCLWELASTGRMPEVVEGKQPQGAATAARASTANVASTQPAVAAPVGGHGGSSVRANGGSAGGGGHEGSGSMPGSRTCGSEPAGACTAAADFDPWEPAAAGARDVLAAAQEPSAASAQGVLAAAQGGQSGVPATQSGVPAASAWDVSAAAQGGQSGVPAAAQGWQAGGPEMGGGAPDGQGGHFAGAAAAAAAAAASATSNGAITGPNPSAPVHPLDLTPGAPYGVGALEAGGGMSSGGGGGGDGWEDGVKEAEAMECQLLGQLAGPGLQGAAVPDATPMFKPVTGAWADEDESDGMEASEGGRG